MRQAMKLGFLGVILALVAAFGLVVSGAAPISAQTASKNCLTNTGTLPAPGGTLNCTVTVNASAAAPLPAGASVQVWVVGGLLPLTAGVTCAPAANFAATPITITGGAGGAANGCAFVNASGAPITAAVNAGTETITIPATAAQGTAITENQVACVAASATLSGTPCGGAANQLPGSAVTGAVITGFNQVGPAAAVAAAGNPVGALGTQQKTCTPTPTTQGNTQSLPGQSPIVFARLPSVAVPFPTTCTINFVAPAGTNFGTAGSASPFLVTSDTIITNTATPPAIFACTGTISVTSGNTGCNIFVAGGAANTTICVNGPPTAAQTTTYPCTLPSLTITGSTNLSEQITVQQAGAVQQVSGTTAGQGFPFNQSINGVAVVPQTATLTCGTSGAVNPIGSIGGVAPGGSIALSLTGTATTCTITPLSAAGTSPVADGTFVVSLVNPTGVVNAEPAVLGCDGPAVQAALQPCSIQNNGLAVQIPCGVTAPQGTAALPIIGPTNGFSVASSTCSSASFTIQSNLAAFLSNPAGTTLPIGANPFTGLAAGTSITINITFNTTPGNFTLGGINLGNFTFTTGAIGTGTLLVTCAPSVIPSNGTLASVCQATFATATTNPFAGLLQAGAFLPGTFTWTTPGTAIFDNGRQEEVVPCGTSAGISSVGINGVVSPFNQIAPVTFTCTGSAVLVIGNGAAGDAPINVAYQSSVGGFTAIGGALVTAVPSGTPRVAITCSPTTIAPGGPGSTCVTTVTDQNGVPLSGLTGSGVTYTVSDPTRATVLACGVAASATAGIGFTPTCTTPTGQVPSQGFTFVNGQSAALVVASPGASAGPVTVTATIGVFVPPSFACFLSPFVPTGTLVGAPSVLNCGSSTALGTTGLATALNIQSLGFGGLITLPNATSASTSITIGTSTTTLTVTGSPVSLTRGCNQVVVSTPTGGVAVSNLGAAVSPASAVVSVWRFNNATKTFQSGFFSDTSAPTDFSTTAGGSEVYFVCVSGAATIASR